MEVPTDEFMRYWKRRVDLADTATHDMISILEEAFSNVPEELEDHDLDQRLIKKSAQITVSRNPALGAEKIHELKNILEDQLNDER
jgi:hypothetical protein